jgi:NADPH:quinone reductase-like Zn-dependent oxidoreductase
MPQSVRAVVVDPSSDGRLTLRTVALPPAAPDDVTIRVKAISLNRGEVNRALSQSEAGARPGWDFAGVVEEPAADRSGPPAGTRVVGMLPTGAWAERLRAPSHAVAALPEGVTDAQAATLPSRASPRCTPCARAGCCSAARCWSMVRPEASGISRFSLPPPRAPKCLATYVAPSRRR